MPSIRASPGPGRHLRHPQLRRLLSSRGCHRRRPCPPGPSRGRPRLRRCGVHRQRQSNDRPNQHRSLLPGAARPAHVHHATVGFFSTSLARQLGNWRPEISYVADNDLWLRMALAGPVERRSGTWSRYRFHKAQRDVQRQRIVREWEQSVRDVSASPVVSPPPGRPARLSDDRLSLRRSRGMVGADS